MQVRVTLERGSETFLSHVPSSAAPIYGTAAQRVASLPRGMRLIAEGFREHTRTKKNKTNKFCPNAASKITFPRKPEPVRDGVITLTGNYRAIFPILCFRSCCSALLARSQGRTAAQHEEVLSGAFTAV